MDLLRFYNSEVILLWTVFVCFAVIAKAAVEIAFRNPSIMLEQFQNWQEYVATFKFLRRLTTMAILLTIAGLLVTIMIDTAYQLFIRE